MSCDSNTYDQDGKQINGKVIAFEPAGAITPFAVIAWLNKHIARFPEIYVVVKDVDGEFIEAIAGDVAGLATSALILQKHALEEL